MNPSLLQKNAEVAHPKQKTQDKARSKMTRRFPAHQCVDLLGLAHVDIDNLLKMNICRRRSWTIVVIATFVLVASVSVSETAEFNKPPTTIKPSSHLTRPVLAQPADELFNDVLVLPHHAGGASLILRDNLFLRRKHLIIPEIYEPRKNPEPRATKYKRYVAFSETHLPNASDSATIDQPANTSETLHSSGKGTLTRVPLYKTHRRIVTHGIPQVTKVVYHEGPMFSSLQADDHARERRTPRRQVRAALSVSPLSRARRNPTADNYYSSRKNMSDYYAERRAVMARFHARQREIEAGYGNRTNSSSISDNVVPRNDPVTTIGNGTLFRLYPSKNSRDNRTNFRYLSIMIDPVYNNQAIKPDDRPDVQEAERRFASRTWNNSNVERQVVRYYTTPIPCANASLSGTLAPKKRSKIADNSTSDGDNIRTTVVGGTSNENNGSDHEIWGECKGKVVYQHNLFLGLKGPSTLDTMFEVIIQGPVCITCVEALRYNETRAKVKCESGGRGHDYVKLKLEGYENEGFSYIIKVWGVRKIGPNCNNM